MKKYLIKFATATSIFMLGISANYSRANAATLYIGNSAYFAPNINVIGFIPVHNLSSENANSQNQKLALMRKIDVLAPGDHFKKQIESDFQDFTQGTIANKSQTNITQKNKNLTGIANAEKINQNIDTRYQGLVETNTEKIDLFTANKINQKLLSSESTQKLSQSLIDETSTIEDNAQLFPVSLTALVVVIISSLGFIILFPVVRAFLGLDSEEGLNILGLSFGKIKIPEEAIALHNKTFKELSILAQKAERINDEKFSNREFILFVKLKYQIAKGSLEYQNICQSIQYLEVAIAASSSYLKIESTELRYRSRKQQAFYQFVIDNITKNVDKLAF